MSFCLAVGSPALVTYSLTITIMNRAWVRNFFKDIRRHARAQIRDSKDQVTALGYESRVKAALFLLQEGQQVPLRGSEEKG